jgi:uncharacterized protein involved in high-affinity Fe2+ transport
MAMTASALVVGGCGAARSGASAAPPAVEGPEATPVKAEVTTPPVTPPFLESDDADAAQLGAALDEGKAVRSELEWVEREEAVASGDIAAGEYLVTYVITPADDYYDLEAAQSNLPAHHTTVLPGSAHVAVVIRDAADGRMVYGLNVHATLRSETGNVKRSIALPFEWHPILNRYGENVTLPEGPFTLDVHVSTPLYHRHDRTNGKRFTRDVTVLFTGVNVPGDSLASMSQRMARGDSRSAIALASHEGEVMDVQIARALHDGEERGAETRRGDYKVAVLIQSVRGYWQMQHGTASYAAADTSVGPAAHLDVSIRDAATGRLVPDMNVRVTILNSRGKEIDTYAMPFMWHPWLDHYGLNVPVPGTGRYTIRVRADAPAFRRFGSSALRKFNKAVDVEVRGVRFVTTEK